MHHRFTLYYWPIPFRGQLPRYILAYAGQSWDEADRAAVTALYQSEIPDQPTPFIAPPILYDRDNDLWLSQAAAICGYLGQVCGLMPGTAAQDALTHKVVLDCLDVLEALTRGCGAQMWQDAAWAEFAETRLPRWLGVFEDLGRRNGLGPSNGTLLGTETPGVADLACAALWATILDKLPALKGLMVAHAPHVLALSQRIAATPAIAALRADQTARWGDVWCEGQIEISLRATLDHWPTRPTPKEMT